MSTLTLSAVTPADLDHFRIEGFWHQRAVFAPTELGRLRADVTALSSMAPGPDRVVKVSQPWLTAERHYFFVPVNDLEQQSAAWGEACRGVLRATAEALIGPVQFAQATGIVKPPLVGQTFPLHQDGIYYGPLDGRYVIANVYLDDVTKTNGSLRVVPRSHGCLLAHDTTRGKKAVPDEAFPTVMEPQAQAGDVLWFHVWTVHGSGPNHSAAIRRSGRVGYLGVSA